MSRDVELPGHCREIERSHVSGVCGHELPCPRHGDAMYCAVPSGIAGVPCGGLLPCPVHSRPFDIGEPVPAPRLVQIVAEPAGDPEVTAMAELVAAVERLDEPARERVLAYFLRRYESTKGAHPPAGWYTHNGVTEPVADLILQRNELLVRVDRIERQRTRSQGRRVELASKLSQARAQLNATTGELVRVREQLAIAHDVLRANGIEPTP